MSNGFDPKTAVRRKRFLTFAGTGAFVVLTGLALPQLFVDTPAAQSPPTTPASEQKVIRATAPLKDEPRAAEPSVGAMAGRLVFGTIFVLALGAGTTYLVARRMRAKPPAIGGPLQVVGSMAVGRGMVYLVKAGDHRLLVGTDMTGLKSLVHLPALVASDGTETADEPAVVLAERVSVTLPDRMNEPSAFSELTRR